MLAVSLSFIVFFGSRFSGNMSTTPLISIIVPVYNKGKHLKKCIDSVIQQSYSNWELLLINDGSVDNSKRVINEFKDRRIIYMEHPNHGVSYTRNQGIKRAKGEYVIFLDADDFWTNSYLEKHVVQITKNESDIYFSGITKKYVDGKVEILDFPYSGYITETEFKKNFYEIQRKTLLYGYTTNKILKLEFLRVNNLLFNERINKSEDLDFYLRCYKKCKSFFFIKEHGYHYIRYPEGTSIYNNDTDFFSLINIQNELKAFCKDNLTDADNDHHAKIICNFASSAISEIPLLKIYTLPTIIKRINNDNTINQYYVVNGNMFFIMVKVFCHRLYVHTAQLFLKIWGRMFYMLMVGVQIMVVKL